MEATELQSGKVVTDGRGRVGIIEDVMRARHLQGTCNVMWAGERSLLRAHAEDLQPADVRVIPAAEAP